MRTVIRFLSIAALLAAAAVPASAANFYVSPTGGGDGSIGSPTDLQTALTAAAASAEGDTVFLQQGTYPAAATFAYAATGADTSPLELSGGWSADFSVRSNDPSLSVLDGQDARRVMKISADGAAVDVTVTIENLTVQNGYTNEYAAPPADTGYGAGIWAVNLNGARLKLVMNRLVVRENVTVHGSSLGAGLATTCDFELRYAEFRDNVATGGGGGITASYSPPYTVALAPTIDDSLFVANRSTAGGGSHLFTYVAPVVRNTTFIGRPAEASSGGGAINSVYGAHPTFEGCLFFSNVGDYWGGAVHIWDSSAEFRNCLFENNKAGASGNGAGGALTMVDDTPASPRTVTVVNCTFIHNRTLGYQSAGGAIYNRVQGLAVSNCIFWENGTAGSVGGSYAMTDESFAATVNYSDVQGGLGAGFSGAHNIDEYPFTGAGLDYPYQLPASSPCVDAGSNAAVPTGLDSDFEGDPRIFGGHDLAVRLVDMGWDEYFNGELAVTSPAEGAKWFVGGAAKTIAWTCTNIAGDVRLSLWRGPRDGGGEVLEIAASVPCADLSYSWTIPGGLEDDDDYALVVESLTYPSLVHWNSFGLLHLHLTSPNRGKWTQGFTYAITWESSGLGGATVLVELFDGDKKVRTIAAATPNDGSHSWKVPFTQAPGNAFRIRVSTADPFAAEDLSDANFRILPAITLTAPNGGQSWKRGTTQAIRWTYRNAPGTAVRLELYKNDVFHSVIAASAPIGAAGAGSYLWRIPPTLPAGTTYTVKVRSATWAKVFDFSNKMFAITR